LSLKSCKVTHLNDGFARDLVGIFDLNGRCLDLLGQAERQGLLLDQLVVVGYRVLVVDLDGVFHLGRVLRFAGWSGDDLLPDVLGLILVLMLVAVLLVVLLDAVAVQLDVSILVR